MMNLDKFSSILVLVLVASLIVPSSSSSFNIVQHAYATMPKDIYALGGGPNSGSPPYEAYNPGTNTWTTIAPPPTNQNGPAAAVDLSGNIYVISGNSGPGPTTAVYKYNPGTNTWTSVAPLPVGSYRLAAATDLSGNIYAIGGYNNGYLNTVYKYNPGTDTWTSVAPLPVAIEGLRAVTDLSGNIYAIGGYTAAGSLNTVYKYDPLANSWTSVASMSTARAMPSVAMDSSGNIYAMGGQDVSPGGPIYNSVEKYNPTTNTWTTVAPMPIAKSAGSAATDSSGNIYAMGGEPALFSPDTDEVDKYNPTTNTWTTVAPLSVGVIDLTVVSTIPPTISTLTTTSLSSSANPSTFANSVTFTATVSPPTATGTVTFTVDGTPQSPVTVSSGIATFSSSSLSVGSHTISAAYSGDTNDASSVSTPFTQTVNQLITTTSLSSSSNPSTVGQSVNFLATVTPSTATGTVTFTIDGTPQPPVTVTGGTAILSTSSLLVGSHTITAAYSGDTNDATSTSSVLTQTVTAIPPITCGDDDKVKHEDNDNGKHDDKHEDKCKQDDKHEDKDKHGYKGKSDDKDGH